MTKLCNDNETFFFSVFGRHLTSVADLLIFHFNMDRVLTTLGKKLSIPSVPDTSM